jgi:hypothetical protein
MPQTKLTLADLDKQFGVSAPPVQDASSVPDVSGLNLKPGQRVRVVGGKVEVLDAPIASGSANVAQRPPALDMNPADPLYAPVENPVGNGLIQAAQGAGEIVRSGMTFGPGMTPTMVADPRLAARGASDVIRGGMGVAAPLAGAALVAAPVVAGSYMVLAGMASSMATWGAKKAGLAQEYADLAGDLAALLALGKGGKAVLDRIAQSKLAGKGVNVVERIAAEAVAKVNKGRTAVLPAEPVETTTAPRPARPAPPDIVVNAPELPPRAVPAEAVAQSSPRPTPEPPGRPSMPPTTPQGQFLASKGLDVAQLTELPAESLDALQGEYRVWLAGNSSLMPEQPPVAPEPPVEAIPEPVAASPAVEAPVVPAAPVVPPEAVPVSPAPVPEVPGAQALRVKKRLAEKKAEREAQPPVPAPPVTPVAENPAPLAVVASEPLPVDVKPVAVSKASTEKAAFEERKAQQNTSALSVKEADDLEGVKYALEDYGLNANRPGDWEPILTVLGSPDARIWMRFAADASPKELQALRDLVLDTRDILADTSARREQPFDADPTKELDTIAARLARNETVQQGQQDIFGGESSVAPAIPPERAPLAMPAVPERPTELSIEALDAYDKELDRVHNELSALRASAEQRPYVPDAFKDGIANTLDLTVDNQTWSERMRAGLENAAADRAYKTEQAALAENKSPEPVITPSQPPPVTDLVARKEAEVRSGKLGAPAVIKRGDAFEWKGTRYRLESAGDNEVSLRNENGNAKTYNAKAIALIEREAGVSFDRGTTKPEPSVPAAPSSLPSIPDIPWEGPKPGTPEYASREVRSRTLTERDESLREKEWDFDAKLKKTSRTSKLAATLQAKVDKIRAERETYRAEMEELRKAGHDAKLQLALTDPNTAPEIRLAIADKILRKRGQPGLDIYEPLKAEAARRLQAAGLTAEEAASEAAELALSVMDTPLSRYAGFDNTVPVRVKKVAESKALKDDLAALDALETKYGGRETGYGRGNRREQLTKAGSAEARKTILGEAEAGYKADKDARDKQEQEGKAAAEQEAALLNNEAQVWAAKGQLYYQRVGEAKGKGGTWKPAKGELVTIPEVPGFRFWLGKVGTGGGGTAMGLTEEQSGLSAFGGKNKAEVMSEGVARVIKNKDSLAKVIEASLENAPPKPALQNWEKPSKKKPAKKAAAVPAAGVETSTAAETAPETPAEAAGEVEKEVRHVIQTDGMKSGAQIQAAVLKTLQGELAGARHVEQARLDWMTKNTEAGTEWEQANPRPDTPKSSDKEGWEKYRQDRASYDAAKEKHRADSVGPFPYGEKPVITIEIPNDGTFTIERSVKAINEVMKRVGRSPHKQTWDDLTKAGLAKRGKALEAWEKAGKPIPEPSKFDKFMQNEGAKGPVMKPGVPEPKKQASMTLPLSSLARGRYTAAEMRGV